MKVVQVAVGRFHHFHLARQLQRLGLLEYFITGYPRFKLRREEGLPQGKIRCFPWMHGLSMLLRRCSPGARGLQREVDRASRVTLDLYAAAHLGAADGVMALSGCGLRSGQAVKARGGWFVCDRGSVHIRFQDELMRAEYTRWGLAFTQFDRRGTAREEAEYALADRIFLPSEFARKSFEDRGVAPHKLRVIPYGVQADLFRPTRVHDSKVFRVLFVGGVSIRKGFLYLLEAFQRLPHPRKQLMVAGRIEDAIKPLLSSKSDACVEYCGKVSHDRLVELYGMAAVCVLPSIEDGFGMTIGEALACGCPVIASDQTGGSEVISPGLTGFVVPAGSSDALLDAMERIAGDPDFRERLSSASISVPSWQVYGDMVGREMAEISQTSFV